MAESLKKRKERYDKYIKRVSRDFGSNWRAVGTPLTELQGYFANSNLYDFIVDDDGQTVPSFQTDIALFDPISGLQNTLSVRAIGQLDSLRGYGLGDWLEAIFSNQQFVSTYLEDNRYGQPVNAINLIFPHDGKSRGYVSSRTNKLFNTTNGQAFLFIDPDIFTDVGLSSGKHKANLFMAVVHELYHANRLSDHQFGRVWVNRGQFTFTGVASIISWLDSGFSNYSVALDNGYFTPWQIASDLVAANPSLGISQSDLNDIKGRLQTNVEGFNAENAATFLAWAFNTYENSLSASDKTALLQIASDIEDQLLSRFKLRAKILRVNSNGEVVLTKYANDLIQTGPAETGSSSDLIEIDGSEVDAIDLNTVILEFQRLEKIRLLNNALHGNFAEAGQLFGTILGTVIAGGTGELGDTFKSTLFSNVGAQLGRYIGAAVETVQSDIGLAIEQGVTNVIQQFPNTVAVTGISTLSGFVSTMLVDEFAKGVGLSGESGDFISHVAGTVLDQVITEGLTYSANVAGLPVEAPDFSSFDDLKNVGWSAAASYVGKRLADEIVEPQNTFSAVSSTVLASYHAGKTFSLVLTLTGNPLLAAGLATVSAFVTTIVTRLFGNLFGSDTPPPPTANAETTLNFSTGYYQIGTVTSANGGNEDLVRNMSEAARDSLNGLISLVTSGSEIAGNANLTSPTQIYGHTANQMWVKLGTSSTKHNFDSADQAIDFGALWAIGQTKISGGNIFLKRAIFNGDHNSLLALSGDLRIAEDYEAYRQQKDFVNAVVAGPYNNLTEEDRNFYDSGTGTNSAEARITRIMAAPRDANGNVISDGSNLELSPTDQSWYNTNKIQVDRIIDGLQVSPFAAGWIVTLQRAAELGLNETSESDFYGGLGGFADSLKLLARTDFDYEDIRLHLDGTTLNVDYGRAFDPLDNLMGGGDLSRGIEMFDFFDYEGGGSISIKRLDDGSTALVSEDTAFNVGTTGSHLGSYMWLENGKDGGRFHDVVEGQTIAFGFEVQRLSSDSSRGYLRAHFYDANGAQITHNSVTSIASDEGWNAYVKEIVVPTGAVEVAFRVLNYGRVSENGPVPTNSQLAYRNFHFSVSDTPFATTPTYTAPVYERWSVDNFFNGADYNQISATAMSSPTQEAIDKLNDMAASQGHTVNSALYTVDTWSGSDVTNGNDIYKHGSTSSLNLDGAASQTVTMTYSYDAPGSPSHELGELTTMVSVDGGDDIFVGNIGDDTLYGRNGFDWLDGGAGDDLIYGGTEDDVILGGDGVDDLRGEDGDDYIAGGEGNDQIRGGDGNDVLVQGFGTGNARGQGGDDLLIATEQSGFSGHYRGGDSTDDDGNDTISFERYSQGIKLDMSYRPADWDTHSNTFYHDASVRFFDILKNDGSDSRINYIYAAQIDNLTGSEFSDDLLGDDAANVLKGLAGDDVLDGGNGYDTLEGGEGADSLIGRQGADTVSYENSDFAVWVDWSAYDGTNAGWQQVEAFGGDAEGDTFHSVEWLRGSAFDDTFEGHYGANRMWGGRGDDWFVATAGADWFYGEEDFDTVDYSESAGGVTVNLETSYGSGNLAAGHRYWNIEHVVGSDYDDVLTGGAEDNVFQGGEGNDHYYGGQGLDTYIYHLGDGQDTIHETRGEGWDTILFGDGITWSDLSLTSGGSGPLRLSIRFTNNMEYIETLPQNWQGDPGEGNRKAQIDAIDVGGVGAVDIQHIEGAPFGGTDSNNTLTGDVGGNKADWVWAYDGNDVIRAAGADNYDTKDNVVIAGRGDDTIYTSVGDDTFVFERGDGVDTIYDTGGEDRIQFGPDVAAEDVIFEVIGTTLYIGIRDLSDPDLSASQVANRIEIMNITAPSTYYDYNSGQMVEVPGNPVIDYITAGGVDIDLRKIDLWNGASSPPSPSNSPPVADPDYGTISSPSDSTIMQVLSNDSDPDGDPLSVTKVNSTTVSVGSTVNLPSGGAVYVGSSGALTYYGPGSGTSDEFTYQISDGRGGTDSSFVSIFIQGGGGGGGSQQNSTTNNGGFLYPIVIDLDGDGADIISVEQSRVVFENDGGGPLWRAGWVGADDGLLVLDRDGDGVINKLSEISFVRDLEGATTDLEGLRAFDTNADGVFDAADEMWGEFRIWQDANQNGVGTSGELLSLEAAGIESIDLGLTGLGNSLAGARDSILLNKALVTMSDGSVTDAFDVALNIQLAHIRGTTQGKGRDEWNGFVWQPDGGFGVAHYGAGQSGKIIETPGWDENDTAALQAIDGGSVGKGGVIPGHGLVRYVDSDDSMTAAPVFSGDPDDPVTPSYGIMPLVIDMDGDGLELVNPFHSSVEIDGNGDGAYDRLGWVSPDDAFLALDRNGDGVINAPSEISFVQDLPGAKTDLEGLRAYDTNNDGWFDASDEGFAAFQVWQDKNFDGNSSASELMSLEQAGISRLALTVNEGTAASEGPLGNRVFGEADLIWADGTVGAIGDVELRALEGNLEEQQYTEYLRSVRSGNPNAAWAFGPEQRRMAIEAMSADLNGADGFSPPDFDFGGLQNGTMRDGALALNSEDPRTAPQTFSRTDYTRQLPVTRNSSASLKRNQVEPNIQKAPSEEAYETARPDLASTRFEGGSRWWAAPTGPDDPRMAFAARSLSSLLADFDQARAAFNQSIAPAAASNDQMPETAGQVAERQRLLQAIASFRGSSGTALPRKLADQAYSDDAMVGAASILRNGAHSLTVA